jgi:uncharacterized protein (DUF2147 family)
MRRCRIAAGLLGLAVAGNAEARTVTGTWKIKDLVLQIYNCEDLVCGKIAWIEDPARRRHDCHKLIVWGLTGNGPNQWDGGSILDPDDSYTYRLSAVLQQDGTLRARIFEGEPMFGQTEILRRVNLRSFAGTC